MQGEGTRSAGVQERVVGGPGVCDGGLGSVMGVGSVMGAGGL